MKTEKSNEPGIWHVVLSILSAAFGVQNNRNREQDFTHGNIVVYILTGVLFTVLFVVSVIMIVNLILSAHA